MTSRNRAYGVWPGFGGCPGMVGCRSSQKVPASWAPASVELDRKHDLRGNQSRSGTSAVDVQAAGSLLPVEVTVSAAASPCQVCPNGEAPHPFDVGCGVQFDSWPCARRLRVACR